MTNYVGSSAAAAYLTPDVLNRPNLTVAVNATAEKILFTKTEGGLPRAHGVRFCTHRSGRLFGVLATREVVLSAGAIASPQLLMVSGIGPKEQLRQHNIDVVRDAPDVGQHLSEVCTSYGCLSSMLH